ncbi:MAG: stomatin-like protein [Candidatus Manganitrophaceae bacterium]
MPKIHLTTLSTALLFFLLLGTVPTSWAEKNIETNNGDFLTTEAPSSQGGTSPGDVISITVVVILAAVVIIVIAKSSVVVPQQSAYVVERLGKYAGTINAGFHILIPFLDVVRYRHSLKEQALDVPEQTCITRDNVQVGVDGVLYLKVMDPQRASYGVTDYKFAISQLAQTTLRSEIGKINLDNTFEERTTINSAVVSELDKAAEPWGVKVLRYEIKSITPPKDVLHAMEQQMRAEREKRAAVLESEGRRDSAGNTADGEKKTLTVTAEGQAEAIRTVAKATADGIRDIAEAIRTEKGYEAVQLRVAEQYIQQFGNLAKQGNTLIVPATLSDVSSIIAMAMNIVQRQKTP